MDLRTAIERNLAFKTEYGAGPRLLGGLYKRRYLKRTRYGIGGEKREDLVHEHEVKLGPVTVEHRSLNPNLIGNDDYEIALTLFGLFGVSNDRDYWIKLRLGPSVGLLGAVPAPQVALVKTLLDCDLTARTGLRFNVSGFLRDLRGEEAEGERGEPPIWEPEPALE